MVTHSSILPGESHKQGAWQATVHGVAKNWTWLKRLSMHACTLTNFFLSNSIITEKWKLKSHILIWICHHWDDPEGWYGEGGGFRMGSTCIPVMDSFWYLAKLIQLCKVKKKKIPPLFFMYSEALLSAYYYISTYLLLLLYIYLLYILL